MRDSPLSRSSSNAAAAPPLPCSPPWQPSPRPAAGRNPHVAAPFAVALRTSLREQHRESEKLGLIEMMFGAERYRSILEIGCGTGEFAGRLLERCARYTGMDEEAARLASAARAVRAGRFVPLELAAEAPFALPPGEHDLVVLSEVLHRLDAARLGRLAEALGAHLPCREIVIVSPVRPLEKGAEHRDAERRLTALAAGVARLEHHALALRGHYRIDALLPPDE